MLKFQAQVHVGETDLGTLVTDEAATPEGLVDNFVDVLARFRKQNNIDAGPAEIHLSALVQFEESQDYVCIAVDAHDWDGAIRGLRGGVENHKKGISGPFVEHQGVFRPWREVRHLTGVGVQTS